MRKLRLLSTLETIQKFYNAGTTVMLLSTDEEGYFVVDQKIVSGEVDRYYL